MNTGKAKRFKKYLLTVVLLIYYRYGLGLESLGIEWERWVFMMVFYHRDREKKYRHGGMLEFVF